MRISQYFLIKIEELCLIQFIFEGYERLVTISTLNEKQGIIKITFFEDSKMDVRNIIKALKHEFEVVAIDRCYTLNINILM